MAQPKLSFASDYMEGAHPSVLQRLIETNLMQTPGYGFDKWTELAKVKIRQACESPQAAVHFFLGGTQTNATVINALLATYQGVISADTGHINVHEAGAIEHGGHKVLTLPHHMGKITAHQIKDYMEQFNADDGNMHRVMPGLIYLSQPTEYGTLYSLQELTAIHQIGQQFHLPIFIDGARLAYGLAAPENDVTLKDLARYSDVFYIGGTKCGTLFGEAVVIPNPNLIPHFFNIMKQHGAVLAKGRLLGVQFEALFTNQFYLQNGKVGIQAATRIKQALKQDGYRLFIDSPTNQIFVILTNEQLNQIQHHVTVGIWEPLDKTHTVIRIVTSWATKDEEVDELISILRKLALPKSK